MKNGHVTLHWRNYGGKISRASSDELKWFGVLRHVGRGWHAEIRDFSTGNLVRYAGIWTRRQDAKDEIEHILLSVEARNS